MRTNVGEPTRQSPAGETDDLGSTTLAGIRKRFVEAELTPGEAIGRYIVEGKLGAGGMGVVYAARDPQLDRPVAIKLIRSTSGDAREGSARLLREAQALARVSDPHVVPVYDVGVVDSRIFVAMELVHGQTLRAWMQAGPHPWPEVLDVLRQAALGLLAVHAAGLVHRDFKPENVLVEEGRQRRVRVMDFGLARHGGAADAIVSDSLATSDSLIATLTRTGSVMGTPVYMSPEQHAGRRVDASSDQFSFCVTAYEALHGVRPFAGETIRQLASHKRRCVLTDPSQADVLPPLPVPSWLHRAIVRGLNPDPSKRWPSMRELSNAMDAQHRRRRTRNLSIAGVTLACGVALSTSTWLDRAKTPCTPVDHELVEVWNPERGEAIERAFLSTGAPHAQPTFRRVRDALEAHASDWKRARVALCGALERTRASHSGSWDEAFACLERRRVELGTLVDFLTAADRTTVDHAVSVVTALARPESCIDGTDDEHAPPPEIAQEVEALRVRMSESEMLWSAGALVAALETSMPVLDRALELEFAPLVAEAQMQTGGLLSSLGRHKEAEALLVEAVSTAEGIGMNGVAADASVYLVYLLGSRQSNCADAMRWSRHARALIDRGPVQPSTEVRLLETMAKCLERESPEKAMTALEQAIALRHRHGHDQAEATAMHALGGVLRRQGRYDESLDLQRRALDLRTRVLGPSHPDIGISHASIALLMIDLGRQEEAFEHAEAAYGLIRDSFGGAHPLMAATLEILATAHFREGRYEQAIDLHRRVVALRSDALDDDHPELASAWANLGASFLAANRREEGRDALLHAAQIQERTAKGQATDAAGTYYNLGMLAFEEGQDAHAQEHFERAHELWERNLGPDHPHVAYSLSLMGRVLLRNGDPHGALPLLERAHAIRNAHAIQGALRAEEIFDLARALFETNAAGTRHIELARHARDLIEPLADAEPKLWERLNQWLERHARESRQARRRALDGTPSREIP